MDREKRRQIAAISLVIIFILLSVLYFLWGTVIDYGKVLITAEAPYTVEEFAGKTYDCEDSPCELKLRAGETTLILRKDDHSSLIEEVEIGIWRTTELNIHFSIKPQIVSAAALPEQTSQKSYEILDDEVTGMQKVVEVGDDRGLPIVFFQGKIDDPLVFSSHNYALVQDGEEIYKIDVRNKQKTLLPGAYPKLEDATFSNSGRYILLAIEDQSNYELIDSDNQTAVTLDLSKNAATAWIINDELIFATPQSYSKEGASEFNYIRPLSDLSTVGYTFGIYQPEDDNYVMIEQFQEIQTIPSNFIPLANGSAIYFQSGEQLFKIILEKF